MLSKDYTTQYPPPRGRRLPRAGHGSALQPPLRRSVTPGFSAVTHQGQLKLIVILPDGTRLRVPATWTDFYGPLAPHPAVLASVAQLLQARAVVTALLRRTQSAQAAAPTLAKEPSDARAVDVLDTITARRGGTGMGDPRRRTTRGDSCTARAPDGSHDPGTAHAQADGAAR